MKKLEKYNCKICKKEYEDLEPEFCCSGSVQMECGCGGLPTNITGLCYDCEKKNLS